jgi:antitoxin component YwqK of YwqJK toxin-antitoxin module
LINANYCKQKEWEEGAIMDRKRAVLTLLIVLLFAAAGCSREVKKEYYPDGKLKSVLNYKKGKLEGIALYYYQNGQLKERVNYRKGKRERTGTTYYESGKLKEEITYVDGKRESIKLYDENGKLISESTDKGD